MEKLKHQIAESDHRWWVALGIVLSVTVFAVYKDSSLFGILGLSAAFYMLVFP